MQELKQGHYTGERALYGKRDLRVVDGVFEDGESPLKEGRNIEVIGSLFRWKYPLWYCKGVLAEKCTWYEMARAGVWYTEDITVRDAVIEAPKNFRRCRNLTLENVAFFQAEETLWHCQGVKLNQVSAKGHYFAMNCSDLEIDGLTLDGNYSFDGVKNAVIRNSRLLTKDAFWNSENVTVYDSFISGEYLGWNAKNLTLINCTIESNQGMCYIDGITLKNCKLVSTTLAFEYSTVEAEIVSGVESVFNPKEGTIRAERIGELIVEKDKVDPEKTKIFCGQIDQRSERPAWLLEAQNEL